jgi:hypothetical protein
MCMEGWQCCEMQAFVADTAVMCFPLVCSIVVVLGAASRAGHRITIVVCLGTHSAAAVSNKHLALTLLDRLLLLALQVCTVWGLLPPSRC